MKRLLRAASLAIVISTNLLCTQAVAVTVTPNPSCAMWAEDRRTFIGLTAMEGWLMGVLNGFAFTADKEFWDSGNGLTGDQVFFWMDRYCDENPLKRVMHGAITLMNERTGTRW